MAPTAETVSARPCGTLSPNRLQYPETASRSLESSLSQTPLDTASVSDDTFLRRTTQRAATTGGTGMTDPTQAEKQFLDAVREELRPQEQSDG
jgi:hypothetical protein